TPTMSALSAKSKVRPPGSSSVLVVLAIRPSRTSIFLPSVAVITTEPPAAASSSISLLWSSGSGSVATSARRPSGSAGLAGRGRVGLVGGRRGGLSLVGGLARRIGRRRFAPLALAAREGRAHRHERDRLRHVPNPYHSQRFPCDTLMAKRERRAR